MALSSSADEETVQPLRKKSSRKRKRVASRESVQFSGERVAVEEGSVQRSDGDTSGCEEMGVLEPRPFEVTSWKERLDQVNVCVASCQRGWEKPH